MPRTSSPELVFRDRTDPASDTGDRPLIGLVPADRVSVVAVELPDLRGRRLEQALRWAAEDALAGDAETQHVVPLSRRDDGRMLCAVASRDDMTRWRAEDPSLVALVPDAAAVPWRSGELVLVDLGDAVLARWGRYAFDRLDPALLDVLLPELVDQAAPERVLWFGESPPDGVAALNAEQRPAPKELLTWLSDGACTPAVDLLYGDFAPSGRNPNPHRGWTIAILALAGLLWFGDALLEVFQLDQRTNALTEEIESRAMRLFPDLQLLPGRERLQIERALTDRGTASDLFVRTVRRASPLFAGLDAIEVQSLVWDGQQLLLDVRAPGLPDLEALQNQLGARGLGVRLDDVTIESGGVRGRLILREAS